MSLNRSEQMVFDYLQAHPDERQFWMDKVRKTSAANQEGAEAANLLGSDLWAYYEERSAVAPPFRDEVGAHGLRRTSMKNLAEHLLRLWAPPRPKPKAPPP